MEDNKRESRARAEDAERRGRYAAAIRCAGVYDWHKLGDAAMTVADEELNRLRADRDAAVAAAVRRALEDAADAVQSHPGAIPFRPQLDEDGGFWWDTRDRDAAAALIRARASAVASPARQQGATVSPTATVAEAAREEYSDLPARAFMENRCLLPPMGCGQPRTRRNATGTGEEEWTLTGLCPDCQDTRAAREQGKEQQPETTAAELARITAERDELLAELDGRDDEARERWIQKNLDETRLRSMDFRNGAEMEIEPARELVAHWVAAARTMLGNAPNYSETVAMDVKVAESPERYSLVVQRLAPGALTPHEARQKAEQERDTLEAELVAARSVVDRVRDVAESWEHMPQYRHLYIHEAARTVRAALDGTDQPTTEA